MTKTTHGLMRTEENDFSNNANGVYKVVLSQSPNIHNRSKGNVKKAKMGTQLYSRVFSHIE